MGYIPLLLMSSFLLLVPGNTLDFTDSISLYIFFGLRGSFPSPCCHTITSFLIYMQQSSAVLLMFPCCRFQEHADLLNIYHKLSAFSVLGGSQLLSNTLSFELFDLLFSSSSSSDGTIGFLVTTRPLLFLPHTHTGKSGGQIHGFSFVRNLVFTMRSSSEWKVITSSRPPGASRSTKSQSACRSGSSSSLTAIRMP